ncbi:MAG TPA: ATP-binding protein [Chloroflexota bacterium]|nr:ATP-binding protein [Chloroflexota bacterium]
MRELSQHLMDLIENSIEAGSRKVAISIDEDLSRDLLTIRVEDDGHGMSQDAVTRATDPFFTSRRCRKVGLGLPLVAATAKRCGGFLTIDSTREGARRLQWFFVTATSIGPRSETCTRRS